MSERPRSRRRLLKSGIAMVSVAGVGGLAGCEEALPVVGSADPGADLLKLVPADANGAYYADVDTVRQDEGIRTVLDAYLESTADSGDGPSDYEELKSTIEDESGLDIEKANEMLAFGEYGDSSEYGGVVLDADWSEEDLIDGLEDGETEYEKGDHGGKTVYESDGEYSRSAVGVLAQGRFVLGTVDAVEDTIDVQAGDGEKLSQDLRSAFESTRKAPVRFVSDVPEEQLKSTGYDDGSAYETEISGETVDYSSVDDIEHSSGAVYADGDTRGVAVNYEAADTDAAEDFEELLTTLKEIGKEESESDDLDGQLEKTTVSRDGTTVTVTYETTVDELGDAVATASDD